MNNNNIIGANGINVSTIVNDNLDKNIIISLNKKELPQNKIVCGCGIRKIDFNDEIVLQLDTEVYNKITECVSLDDFYNITNNIHDNIDVLYQEKESLISEINDLKKIIAKLNTRVNNLIAEKQLKEFYEKNGSDKCISSVVEKQHVISN